MSDEPIVFTIHRHCGNPNCWRSVSLPMTYCSAECLKWAIKDARK